MADDPLSHRSRKFHEGWLQIKVKGDWTKYWAVLRGQTIYFFQSNKTSEQNHVGTLYLDGQTEAKSLGPEGLRKKTYKMELYTHHPARKCNSFKFDKENDRDVWKCYIIGISTGNIPRDVKILPGQRNVIMEAIGEMMQTPPPLPTLPRPRLANNVKDFNRKMSSKMSESSWTSNGSEESDKSGSFGTHITTQQRARSKSMPHVAKDENVNNMRTLYRDGSVTGPERTPMSGPVAPPTNGGRNHHMSGRMGDSSGSDECGSESSIQWSEFSIGSPPPKSSPGAPRGQHVMKFSELVDFEWGDQSIISGASRGMAGSPPPAPPSLISQRPTSPVSMTSRRPPTMNNERRPSTHATLQHQTSDYGSGSNSSEVHQFFPDPGRNREHPPWFFENTSRELAESILTLGKRYGNVLMRESVTFKNTGSYVISMRREVAGGTQLNHYEVQKTPTGFKINVDNEHRPMRCLNDVMEFFVRQAGHGSSPLRTNNLTNLGLNVPAQPGRRGSDSGMEDDDGSNNSAMTSRSNHSSPAVTTLQNHGRTAQRPGKLHMNITGNVPNEMSTVAMDISYTMQKSTPKWEDSRMAKQPVPPGAPPSATSLSPLPPTPPAMAGAGSHQEYGNMARYGDFDARARGSGPPQEGAFSDPNLNRTVPPRLPPTETLQRAASHHETYYNHHQRDQRQSGASDGPPVFDSPSVVDGPPAPPPPPLVGSPNVPPPPPAATADLSPSSPAPISGFQAMIQQGAANQARRATEQSQAPPQPTTPTRGRIGGGELTFKDELEKRLIAQREDVYASGATVLRSANWQ